MPGFHSLSLELLCFVWTIKYSLGKREESRRLTLLPSCSGAHLGGERSRVKVSLQRWLNYLYKVEQLQQEGRTYPCAWQPFHAAQNLFLSIQGGDTSFLLPSKCLLLALWFDNFSFLTGQELLMRSTVEPHLGERHGSFSISNSFFRIRAYSFSKPDAHLSPWCLSSPCCLNSAGSHENKELPL